MTDAEIITLVKKEINGGNKCLRGERLEMKLNSVQSELTEEKIDRKKNDAVIYSKFDKLNMTIIIGIGLMIVSVIISNLFLS